jgi:hypothetical protein
MSLTVNRRESSIIDSAAWAIRDAFPDSPFSARKGYIDPTRRRVVEPGLSHWSSWHSTYESGAAVLGGNRSDPHVIAVLTDVWGEQSKYCAVASARQLALAGTFALVLGEQQHDPAYPADGMTDDEWAAWFCEAESHAGHHVALDEVEEVSPPRHSSDESLVPLDALRFAGSTMRRRANRRLR